MRKKQLILFLLLSLLAFSCTKDPEFEMREYACLNDTLIPTVITVNSVSFKMIVVKGGTFTMGGTDEQGFDVLPNEIPTHSVTLNDFCIAETEVMQALWASVMGTNPSEFNGYDRPVENVSWDDCQNFIEKLNQKTNLKFRLPTEAEWEYAARGGASSQRHTYSGNNELDSVGWYNDNSENKTHSVKSKGANELGIYDMSGNVGEWCSDWYGEYDIENLTNPTGPLIGVLHVFRGGSFDSASDECRVSHRAYANPTNKSDSRGLRLVLVP